MPCGYGKWDSELVKTRKKKGTKEDRVSQTMLVRSQGILAAPKLRKMTGYCKVSECPHIK